MIEQMQPPVETDTHDTHDFSKPTPSEHIHVLRIETLEELQRYMPLFNEGYEAIQKNFKNLEVDKEGFVKTLFGVLNSFPRNGICVAIDIADEEPIGFTVGFDATPHFSQQKILLLWALYSKGRNPHVSPALMEEGTAWAKEQGYEKMTAFSSRFSGAGFKFFEDKLGLRRSKIYYTKEI